MRKFPERGRRERDRFDGLGLHVDLSGMRQEELHGRRARPCKLPGLQGRVASYQAGSQKSKYYSRASLFV